MRAFEQFRLRRLICFVWDVRQLRRILNSGSGGRFFIRSGQHDCRLHTHSLELSDYPKVVSCFQTTQTFGGLMFAAVPGFLADRTGDYIVAYVIMFVLILLSAVVLQTSYTFIKIRDKKTMETVMN